MKAILMSIRPQWVAKILNGEKTIEIRKKFPKDYVGWVYIYCTKDCKDVYREFGGKYYRMVASNLSKKENAKDESSINGKVVARFWCDKVKGTYNFYVEELCQFACISKEELYKYAGGWYKTYDLLAIHITKLEIFDKPMEIKDLVRPCQEPINYCGETCLECPYAVLSQYSDYDDALPRGDMKKVERCLLIAKLKAPQSWCYVEV